MSCGQEQETPRCESDGLGRNGCKYSLTLWTSKDKRDYVENWLLSTSTFRESRLLRLHIESEVLKESLVPL